MQMKKISLFVVAMLATQTAVFAQGRGGRGGGAAAPAQTPKASAPIDVTGGPAFAGADCCG